MTELLTTRAIDVNPAIFVRQHSTIVAEFDHRTQDSGNVSWLVDAAGRRLFVKTAGLTGEQPAGAPVPYFNHEGRVRLLRNAVELAASCSHPALARLLNVIESPDGPTLVYEAATGELVHARGQGKEDPNSAYQRFGHLPAGQLLGIFDALIDLHVDLTDVGWVAVDLYAGCLIVDFATAALTVVDLDTYRRGPSRNDMGRMFGSSTFMAPEEFELGAVIDQRTTMYTLGRLIWHFGSRLSERADQFCGPPAVSRVVERACLPSRGDRFDGLAEFAQAWRLARNLTPIDR